MFGSADPCGRDAGLAQDSRAAELRRAGAGQADRRAGRGEALARGDQTRHRAGGASRAAGGAGQADQPTGSRADDRSAVE